MIRQDWAFCMKRMEAYFQRSHDPLLEEELYLKFCSWDIEEWDAVWAALTEMTLPRMPGYGEFVMVLRGIKEKAQQERNKVTIPGDAPFPREGLKSIAKRIIELHDAHVGEFKDDNQPKPLNQVMVGWFINWTNGLMKR